MADHEQMLRSLDRATETLSGVPCAALAAEGLALAALLRSYRVRAALALQGAGAAASAPEAKTRRRSCDLKHWTPAELERIGKQVPFAPIVYTSSFWERRGKRFHRPTCAYARDGDSIDLEIALAEGYRPCEECGGVRPMLNLAELSVEVEELLRRTDEIRNFVLGDYRGLIGLYEASRILGIQVDEIRKTCREAAAQQLKNVREDRFFRIFGYVNVLRYREQPSDRTYSFRFRRPDCVRYSQEWGPLSMPRR